MKAGRGAAAQREESTGATPDSGPAHDLAPDEPLRCLLGRSEIRGVGVLLDLSAGRGVVARPLAEKPCFEELIEAARRRLERD